MPLNRAIAIAAAIMLVFAGTLPASSCGTSPAVTPTPSPKPSTPASDLELEIMILEGDRAVARSGDSVEFTVATWGIPIVGVTRQDAIVSVDGSIVEVNEDGLFVHQVDLQDGPNLVEVVASDLLGNQRTTSVLIYQITTSGIPLHVMWPAYDAMVIRSSIPVFGATSVDAIVSIDGMIVDVSPLGLFSGTASLKPGPNIIEVTASDLTGKMTTEQLVVYLSD